MAASASASALRRALGMMSGRAPARIALALMLLVVPLAAQAAQACGDLLTLRFTTETGERTFRAELADTPEERARGLMFRESLPPDAGMLFVYERAHPVAFWMKNTLIPLDMIFMDEQGRVVRLHENAVPHDETPIPSGAPARHVLELAGGTARAAGLVPGARMITPRIGPADRLVCE